MITIKLILLLIFSYLLGNVHFARIISKARKDDITKHGSGNPGTMNMVRTHGIMFGSFTLVLDALKGAIPALVAYFLFAKDGGNWVVYSMHIAGLLAVIGHIFPVIYKFKGGKGVATAFGFFTVVNPIVSAILFAVGLILFFTLKIGSLSSLIYITGFVFYETVTNFNLNHALPLVTLYLVALLIYLAHSSNMKRLITGKENKVNIKECLEKDKTFIKSKIDQKNSKTKNGEEE